MNAQIFSLKGQYDKARKIEEALRREFFEGIEVTPVPYDLAADVPRSDPPPYANYVDSLRVGRSYLTLLRASMVTSGDFTLAVENAHEIWGYWNYESEKTAQHSLKLRRDSTEKVFPAVALMDRMVMVPERISPDAFDVPSGFAYLLKPLHLDGVLLVDFEDEEAIRRAVRRVGSQARSEIVSLGRRQMTLRRIPTPDAQSLGELLHVDASFIDSLREEILKPAPELVVKAVGGPLRLNGKSPVTLEIRNEGQGEVGVVDVQIRAPSTVMPARYSRWLDFSSGDQTVEIEVDPQAVPYLPLEVMFLFNDTIQGSTFPIPVILDVVKE